ncbi:MAG: hypothetical protein HRT71_05770 [Flavobacteriales bacterium]|nr:hypothetical protein [Flavobacteriales bacterium]
MAPAFDNIKKARASVEAYVENENFKGYDPYDTLNSTLPFNWLGKWGPVLAIQFQKRNPLNIRPAIGIKKEHNPKAIGLFLHAYSIKYLKDPNANILNNMRFMFRWLKENRNQDYTGYCWGYNFGWASPDKFLPANSPTIVVSGFIAKGLFAYYKATEDKEAIVLLKGIAKFILTHLTATKDKTGTCYSYSTVEADCCYNASMLGAEVFAFLFYLTKENQYAELAINATNFVVARQQENGCWNYSINIKTNVERKQVDFHQGYILDSLKTVIDLCASENSGYKKAWKNGINFYRQNQFFDDGRAIWRLPQQWPVDIHNQSQGIITLSESSDVEHRKFAAKIAEWTIENMRNENGSFYYKKYATHSIKTPFMRWGQAWMFLALVKLTHPNQQ